MKQWVVKSIIIITAGMIISVGCGQEPLRSDEPESASSVSLNAAPTQSLTPTPIVLMPTVTTLITESVVTPTFNPIYSKAAIQLFSEEFSVVKNSSQLELDPSGDNEQEVADVEFRITRSGGGDYYFFFLFPINGASVWFWGDKTPNFKNCMVEPPEFSNRAPVDKVLPGAYICVITSQGNVGRIHVTDTNLPEGWVKLDFDTWLEVPE